MSWSHVPVRSCRTGAPVRMSWNGAPGCLMSFLYLSDLRHPHDLRLLLYKYRTQSHAPEWNFRTDAPVRMSWNGCSSRVPEKRSSNHGLVRMSWNRVPVRRYRNYVSVKNFLNFLPEKKCPNCESGMSSNGTGKNCRNCVSANLKNAPGTKNRKSASESRSSGSVMMKTLSGNR